MWSMVIVLAFMSYNGGVAVVGEFDNKTLCENAKVNIKKDFGVRSIMMSCVKVKYEKD